MSTKPGSIEVQPEPAWYVAMTQPRHEKAVAARLTGRGVECFLPLYEAVHRWSRGQKAEVQLPLFPGYVFAHVPLSNRLQVLADSSVLRLVSFAGEPATVPDDQIEALRDAVKQHLRLEPHPYLPIDGRVRIRQGAFAGLEGTLVRQGRRTTVVVSIEMIQRAVAVEIDVCDVRSLA